MDELKLLACPFCGSAPILDHATLVRDTYHWVRCGNQKCRVIPSAMQCLREADAIAAWNARAPAVPEGWVLVPVVPTQEMLTAMYEAPENCEKWDTKAELARYKFRGKYAAMLAAAPKVALPAVPEWRDIASAPRNNSSRLVWCPLDRCIYCVTWVDNSDYPPARSGWQVFGGGEIIDGVTHWMPLPAAPKVTP